ncbi:hypothetical protein AAFF_G00300970 [Aldrovandia affinis]|uniref:Uncharacterized protein n=1 Tax=Aldrovandia affinis TaxID=143900 RepID=A0AAD7SQ22_9TELE|nr:hypothetical protein AAFF_G00300970 [Aldrovandia affinis]
MADLPAAPAESYLVALSRASEFLRVLRESFLSFLGPGGSERHSGVHCNLKGEIVLKEHSSGSLEQLTVVTETSHVVTDTDSSPAAERSVSTELAQHKSRRQAFSGKGRAVYTHTACTESRQSPFSPFLREAGPRLGGPCPDQASQCPATPRCTLSPILPLRLSHLVHVTANENPRPHNARPCLHAEIFINRLSLWEYRSLCYAGIGPLPV